MIDNRNVRVLVAGYGEFNLVFANVFKKHNFLELVKLNEFDKSPE